MEYPIKFVHSTPIEHEVLRRAGVFTTFPVRLNKYGDIGDEGTKKALHVWRNYIKQDGLKEQFGETVLSTSPVGNMWTCITPEALPERALVVAYLAELFLIFDDYCETLNNEQCAREYDLIRGCWTTAPRPQGSTGACELNMHQALSEGMLEMLEIDRRSAMRVISYWRTWMTRVGRVPNTSSIKEFIAHRTDEAGIVAWWPALEFMAGLDYTDEERASVQHMTDRATELFVWGQDYWSWDKEYHQFKEHGTRMMNLVEVISRTENVSFEDARAKVKNKALALEKEFFEEKDRFFKDHPNDSARAKGWIETLGLSIGGYHYFAAHSDRYHGFKQQVTDSDASRSSIPSNSIPPSHTSSESQTSVDAQPADPLPAQGNGETSESRKRPRSVDNDSTDEQPVEKKHTGLGWHKPDDTALAAPSKYIGSLPSKGIRSTLITALNHWLHAPRASAARVETIVKLLHDASLLVDDVQDNTMLRRGKPAAHTIFGAPQTLNSGLFMFCQAIQEARNLCNPKTTDIALQNLETLYLGQSWDLYWKHNLSCPSEEDYLNMVDNKTGSMFRLIVQLLQAESQTNATVDLEPLIRLLGRFFQIRDDYMNLESPEYFDKKGFCEDLDEGKFSYPIVHLLRHAPQHKGYVTGIFRQLPHQIGQASPLTHEAKADFLDILKSSGTLKATLEYLKQLETDIGYEIRRLEDCTGEKNPMLRLMIATLSVSYV